MSRIKTDKVRTPWQVTSAELEIFKLARTDPNWFSNYYFKSATGGTYYRRNPDPPDEKQYMGWKHLFDAWQAMNAPDDVFVDQNILYQILWDEEQYPIFWNHHGFIFQGWQVELYQTPQHDVTVIGGVGSGKTVTEAAILMVLSTIIPNFRGFAIAPQMIQAMEVYNHIQNVGYDTLWWERYVWKSITKPYPLIEVRSSHVGKSTIEILSIESDPDKVRTLEGDMIFLDQAEKFEELTDLTLNLGTRLRGTVRGRPRLGKLIYMANAGDSPDLWARFDMAELEPENYKSFQPSSDSNEYLTDEQKKDMRRRVGGSQADIDQWMNGNRPPGRGEHFPATMVARARDNELDRMIDDRIAQQIATNAAVPDAWKRSTLETGVYEWVMPPDRTANIPYIVIGDPGQGNPPRRNSGCVMVWDVDGFPKRPMTLRAFKWVFGNGLYDPFLSTMSDWIKEYRAQGMSGFDSTGSQKGFDELYFVTRGIHVSKLDMGGQEKYLALNAAKFFMERRLVQFPFISHLINQLTNYKLPDTKLRQDLVMTLAMSCLYAKRYFYIDIPDPNGPPPEDPSDYPHDRHSRPSRSRTARAGVSRR